LAGFFVVWSTFRSTTQTGANRDLGFEGVKAAKKTKPDRSVRQTVDEVFAKHWPTVKAVLAAEAPERLRQVIAESAEQIREFLNEPSDDAR